MNIGTIVETAASKATDRLDLWSRIVSEMNVVSMAEVGVYKGDFASQILKTCPAIERYYMIDPWRHLDDWNKPANAMDQEFAQIKDQALRKTEFAAGKRIVLQGRTTEVSKQLPEHDLDLGLHRRRSHAARHHDRPRANRGQDSSRRRAGRRRLRRLGLATRIDVRANARFSVCSLLCRGDRLGDLWIAVQPVCDPDQRR
jgi:hypothetical protein